MCILILNAALFQRPTNLVTFVTVTPIGDVTCSVIAATFAEATPPIPLTAEDITTQKVALDKRKSLYNKYPSIEAALCNQTIDVTDAYYLHP